MSHGSLSMEGYEAINDDNISTDSITDAVDSGQYFLPSSFYKSTDQLYLGPHKKSLREVAELAQYRYMKGGAPKRTVDDLIPAPLRFGEISLLDMLKEGPPEDFDQPSATSSAAKASAAISSVPKSTSAGSVATTAKSGTLRKVLKINKPSLASVRNIFSPKPKHSEAMKDVIELTESVTDSTSPLHLKHATIVSGRKANGSTNPTSPQLLGQDSPEPTSPFGDHNKFATPHDSASTYSSAGKPHTDHDFNAQRTISSSSDKKTAATTPTHSSRGPFTPLTTTSTNPSPGKIYGQPPACMIRPVVPHKVTEKHLGLTSLPPVSKEDISKLPKEIEPTLPSPELSPLVFGQRSQPNEAEVEAPTFVECDKCERFVYRSWIGICPVKGCRAPICKVSDNNPDGSLNHSQVYRTVS